MEKGTLRQLASHPFAPTSAHLPGSCCPMVRRGRWLVRFYPFSSADIFVPATILTMVCLELLIADVENGENLPITYFLRRS